MSLEVNMAKIRIDGIEYEVKPEKNLLETCLALGIDIPHFCFHPALGSVGACRLCAVKKFRDKDDTKGRIVMSCMEPVVEGMIISVNDSDAISFRASVIESLMTNHPHDCPVCDEGGECHLQDMTVMTGHNYRRFDFAKRTYYNQELGPFISHEMNRCIQCYRCIRFYRDYAGGKDLNVFASRNHVYFGRHEDGILGNEFSGNLVEVCPTGVFTDKTLKKHFTRKWDLSNAPSVCVHCSAGCNIIASERYGSLRRIMSRYNGAVNGYFICDRGRFGYEFVNDEKRIQKALFRSEKNIIPEPVQDQRMFSILDKSFSKDKRIVGIGSPRASLESNFALLSLVGHENFYHGIPNNEYLLTKKVTDYLQNSGVLTPSLKQIEKADAILVLGEDLINSAPMIALALRQAARNVADDEARGKGIPLWNDAPLRQLMQESRYPVFIATPLTDSLDEISVEVFRASYNDIANLGFSVAKNLDRNVTDRLSGKKESKLLAEKIAFSLKNARSPLIVSGVSSGNEAIINAALNITTALLSSGINAMLSMVLPECNSMGLSLLPGKPFGDGLIFAENEKIDTLVIIENDLYRRANEDSVNELFRKSNQVIVLDHLPNKTVQNADLSLPATTFAESEGTIVNNEGRAQRFYKAINSKTPLKESWRWIAEFMLIRYGVVSWNRCDEIVESLANELPVFLKLKRYVPGADFRMLNMKIPRQTIRYSGRTAMNANVAVSEPKLPQDTDSPLTFSMEGQQEIPPSSLVPFYWTPGWNSVQAMYGYLDKPNGSMKGGDPGVRLIEPAVTGKNEFFRQETNIPKVNEGEYPIVPVYQIYGSEELSSVGTSMIQRIKNPFVLMNQKDADILAVNDGDHIQLEIVKAKLNVEVKIDKSLAKGLVALSVNLPGMPFVALPGSGKFHKL
jgi:NADH-quinone oxidoreductase subunit G